MKRLNGEESRKKSYGYGPVIVLMAACLCVMAAMVLAFFLPDSSKIENTEIENEIQISENAAEEALVEEEVKSLEDILISVEELLIPESEEIEEEKPLFTVSDPSYFDDALFIGDSRTVGLRQYGTFENTDYFASPGLSLYSIETAKVEMKNGRKMKLEEVLAEKTYGKVYIMLGINELGYDFDATVGKYQKFIDYVFGMQPDAIMYVCANMHVNSLRNELDDIHNNTAINRMNEQISLFADNEKIFYLDVNPVFDDEEGNLSNEYSSDDTHLKGMYYEMWCNWYCENTVVLPDC